MANECESCQQGASIVAHVLPPCIIILLRNTGCVCVYKIEPTGDLIVDAMAMLVTPCHKAIYFSSRVHIVHSIIYTKIYIFWVFKFRKMLLLKSYRMQSYRVKMWPTFEKKCYKSITNDDYRKQQDILLGTLCSIGRGIRRLSMLWCFSCDWSPILNKYLSWWWL